MIKFTKNQSSLELSIEEFEEVMEIGLIDDMIDVIISLDMGLVEEGETGESILRRLIRERKDYD